jgi:hypothetical protein
MTGRFLRGGQLHSTDPKTGTPHSGMTERINLHRFLLDKINLARLKPSIWQAAARATAPVRAYCARTVWFERRELTLISTWAMN